MRKTVSALKARKNLGELLEEVYYRGDQYIIERAGKPMAAVVPLSQLEVWQEQREAFFRSIETVRQKNRTTTPETIERRFRRLLEAPAVTSQESMIRAVLDANVFISGILNAKGAPGQVLEAWRAEQFQLLISAPILEELERVLHYPKLPRAMDGPRRWYSNFCFV